MGIHPSTSIFQIPPPEPRLRSGQAGHLPGVLRPLLPFLLLFVLSVSLIFESIHDSPTYDEPANMAASFAYVYKNDFRLYPDNPPLIKILAGISLLPIAGKINFPDHLPIYNDPAQFDLYKFGTQFLYQNGNPAQTIIFLTRLPNIIITVLLGIVLYLIAGKLYGHKAALLAIFLYCLDPNIRGHGHILAYDIPLAFISLLTFYLLLQFINQPKKRLLHSVFLVLTFTAGYLTKFTFVFVAFIYILIYQRFHTPGESPHPSSGLPRPAFGGTPGVSKALLFGFLSLIIVPFLLIWIFGLSTNYNKPTLNYGKLPIIESAGKVYKNDFAWNVISSFPVPYYYKAGMQTMYSHNNLPGQPPAFLLGEVHAVNDWFFYFPVSFLLKTPIPTLMVILLTMYLMIKNIIIGKKVSPGNFFPFLFALYFTFMLMLFSHINNVYRYLFPSLIFFILGASQIVNLIEFNKLIWKIVSLIAICYLLITSIISFPFDLSYTNEFTGIPPRGYKFLSDSEIDWGQDLKRLGEWMEKNNNLKPKTQNLITLSYLGTADPEHYGIKYKPLKFEDLNKLSGTVVISIGNLTLGDWQWTSKPEYKAELIRAPLDFLRATPPQAVIGKSIFVYRF